MRIGITALAGTLVLASCLQTPDMQEEIERVLRLQQDAWNQGDIPGFMDHYYKSETLTFAGVSGIRKGHETVLKRYLDRYDTPEKMGQLSFTLIEFYPLSSESAVLVGKWALKRVGDNPSGYFTLVWKKIDGNWKIIHDHTS
jgi:ketosteroid isomerase-like protein